jgi:aspartyl/asparaginyl beta-hydroxylase (cupin superfamily)
LKFGFSTTSLPKNTGYFWQVCPLIYGKHPIPSIFWHEEVEECFTTKMISSFKVKPILAIFSMIEPGGIVKPHRDHDDDLLVGFGYTKTGKETIIKYHLSVDIPNDGECSLTVAGQTRLLNNGDLNPFDETSEHSVVNTSTQRRGALIMSFLRSEIY